MADLEKVVPNETISVASMWHIFKTILLEMYI